MAPTPGEEEGEGEGVKSVNTNKRPERQKHRQKQNHKQKQKHTALVRFRQSICVLWSPRELVVRSCSRLSTAPPSQCPWVNKMHEMSWRKVACEGAAEKTNKPCGCR